MLILYLLDPQQSQTLQQWQFAQESLVRIGRANDNDVVISSDLISRYHVELHQIQPQQWQLISKGTNGTFYQGKQIDQLMVSSAMQVQLAKGGLWLKFELPLTVTKPLISTEPDPRIGQLETILSGINAQFPREFLSQRQGEIDKRLGTIQELQAKLKEAIKLAEKTSQDQDIVLKILSETHEDLELQKQVLQQLISRIEEYQQLLEDFQKHIDSNELLAQKLPNCDTRVDQLMQTVQQQLKELDQELGRVHAQHLLNSAKRSFSL